MSITITIGPLGIACTLVILAILLFIAFSIGAGNRSELEMKISIREHEIMLLRKKLEKIQ